MRMEQGVRTGLGQGASPVSYRHNFLVFFFLHQCFVALCLGSIERYSVTSD